MKIIGRIIIVLVAAVIVSGVATLFVSNSDAQTRPRPQFQEQTQTDGTSVDTDSTDNTEASRRPERGGHGGERGGSFIFGIVGILQNVAIMGAIVLGVTLVPRVKGLMTRLTGSVP
ncbi:MAG: hypothetical protein KDI79_20180 [Anaerolineae bacterium]|nr:hypothetical protein [Anaerolineae bacterium]